MLGAWILLGLSGPASAQSPIADDFGDGNDIEWTRYDPIGVGSWSFPSGGYRIQAAASPNPGLDYPERAGAVRHDASFTDVVAAADLVAWNSGLVKEVFGIGGRLTDIGLSGDKTSDGYLLTLRPSGASIAPISSGVTMGITGSILPAARL